MSSSPTKKPWVNVAVFESLAEGQKLEMFLKTRRIEARTYHDKPLQFLLFMCPPHATFRVQVRANAFGATVGLLDKDPDAAVVLAPAIHCPFCGSLSISYPQMTRKFFLPTVALHLGIIFRILRHEAYCEKCHYRWQLPRPQTPELSRLNASGH